jgi:hypothetical protein
VDHVVGLATAARFLKPHGHLSVVLQLPNDSGGPVSQTRYQSLQKLERSFKFISPDECERAARSVGLDTRASERYMLESGNSFHEFLFTMSQ